MQVDYAAGWVAIRAHESARLNELSAQGLESSRIALALAYPRGL